MSPQRFKPWRQGRAGGGEQQGVGPQDNSEQLLQLTAKHGVSARSCCLGFSAVTSAVLLLLLRRPRLRLPLSLLPLPSLIYFLFSHFLPLPTSSPPTSLYTCLVSLPVTSCYSLDFYLPSPPPTSHLALQKWKRNGRKCRRDRFTW